jgi:hypothetical protein
MKFGVDLFSEKCRTSVSCLKMGEVIVILYLGDVKTFLPVIDGIGFNSVKRISTRCHSAVILFVKSGVMAAICYLREYEKCCLISYNFRPIWIKFGVQNRHVMLFGHVSFVKIC